MLVSLICCGSEAENVKSSPASCDMLRLEMIEIFSEFSEDAGIPIEPLRVDRKSQTVRIVALDGAEGGFHHREVLPSGVVVGGIVVFR